MNSLSCYIKGTSLMFLAHNVYHGACVTYTPEFMHHTHTRSHEDTLHILHDIYSTYTPQDVSHVCHTYTTYTSQSRISLMYAPHINQCSCGYSTYTPYTQRMHHGGCVTCVWGSICRAIIRSISRPTARRQLNLTMENSCKPDWWGESQFCGHIFCGSPRFREGQLVGGLVYCMGVDSGGPAQHVLEVKIFMIMHFYIKPFKPC